MKRINCLILNNEIWALRLRLQCEYDFYDRFVITESRMTFAGDEKPLYFERYRHEIADPQGKIIYDVLDTLPIDHDTVYMTGKGQQVTGNRWPAEHAMRNACARVLEEIGIADDDVLVIQDVDEIANIEDVAEKCAWLSPRHVHRLGYHDFRETVAPIGLKKDTWFGGFVMKGSLRHEDFHDIRRLYFAKGATTPQHWHIQSPLFASKLDGSPMYELIQRPDLTFTKANPKKDKLGWHFSSMSGGFTKLRQHKRNSFAHAEIDKSGKVVSDDYWKESVDFFAQAQAEGRYDYTDLSEALPPFISSRIQEFPILLQPKG